MCGLAGFWDPARGAGPGELDAAVLRMADTLVHRGPNDRGSWVDPGAGLALGFRRLAILDLTPEGHQPMSSAGGRYVLAFNGEIYNHADLRRELEGGPAPPAFRGHSDTEVMLAAFERWGPAASLGRFVGMFAFALWDRHERALRLGRDRLGEKPLYYGRSGAALVFGSELKALRAHPDFRGEIDREALALYLRCGYVPAPHSIFRGVRKLPPGTTVTVTDPAAPAPDPVPYWSAREAAEAGAADPFAGTPGEAVDELEGLLRGAVRRQMVADVPLGAFLSGGIDSSALVALMQAESDRPVRTFTIGFREPGFNEAEFAAEVSRHLGTEHTELYVTADDARAVIPDLPRLYDEPFADSSGVPVYLVSKMAVRQVTVCLSGDGGDELFAGYPWYPRVGALWGRVRRVPGAVRRAAAGALAGVPEGGWDRAGRALSAVLPGPARKVTGDRARMLAGVLGGDGTPESLHRLLQASWDPPGSLVLGADGAGPGAAGGGPDDADPVRRLMALDMVTYLPDDILVKVDRASMGVSLETRAPYLDHRVVEFAWRLPTSLKLRDGKGKWVLRQVLHRHVPAAMVERPKAGFSVPIAAWLRGPLRDWAEDLLSADRLAREGLLDPGPVRRRWAEHLCGARDWATPLWNVLMFEAWLETWGPHGP